MRRILFFFRDLFFFRSILRDLREQIAAKEPDANGQLYICTEPRLFYGGQSKNDGDRLVAVVHVLGAHKMGQGDLSRLSIDIEHVAKEIRLVGHTFAPHWRYMIGWRT